MAVFGLTRSFRQGSLFNRPLCLSVQPDRAELFWSAEEVTITERQPAEEAGLWCPVSKGMALRDLFYSHLLRAYTFLLSNRTPLS